MLRILAVMGTRPEVIKLGPLVDSLAALRGRIEVEVCTVYQQTSVIDRALVEWGLNPVARVPFEWAGEVPSDGLVDDLQSTLRTRRPDWVVVQGDTTTALAGAVAAANLGIACAHVEAGLRTGDPEDPYPEELNRVRIARLASVHYAPTEQARYNLLEEGYADENIRVVGNTGIDALARWARVAPRDAHQRGRRILVTGHRNENRGAGMRQIGEAIRRLVARHPDLEVDVVLHPNPDAHVLSPSGRPGCERIHVWLPVGHRRFIELLSRAYLVLTDSGGVQEEALFFGTPVLVTRAKTERPEGTALGTAWLVGSDTDAICCAVDRLLKDNELYSTMSRAARPYGDGRAAERIRDDLLARHWAAR